MQAYVWHSLSFLLNTYQTIVTGTGDGTGEHTWVRLLSPVQGVVTFVAEDKSVYPDFQNTSRDADGFAVRRVVLLPRPSAEVAFPFRSCPHKPDNNPFVASPWGGGGGGQRVLLLGCGQWQPTGAAGDDWPRGRERLFVRAAWPC